MRRSRSYVIAGLLAAGVLFAGCGGDDGESDTAADEATTEETAVDAVTGEEYQAQIEEALAPLSEVSTTPPTSPEQGTEQLAQIEGALSEGVENLQGVEPPAELQEPHDRLIAAFETFQQATADAQESAEAGDTQALTNEFVPAATEFQQELVEISQDLQAAGLELQPQAPPGGGGGGN